MKKYFRCFVLAVCAVMMFASCGKDEVYKERVEFDNLTWPRLTEGKTVKFDDIEIKDTATVYDIYVAIRHTPYISEKSIKFLMRITSQEGITRESVHTIKLTDRYGEKWIGDAAGDLIDVEEKCRSFISFPSPGKYSVSITNMATHYTVTGIIDMGLRVVKSDLDNYNADK